MVEHLATHSNFRIRWSDGQQGVFSTPALSQREALRDVRDYLVATGDSGARIRGYDR